MNIVGGVDRSVSVVEKRYEWHEFGSRFLCVNVVIANIVSFKPLTK